MKIAFFTDTFLPQTNGVVSSVLTLASGLRERQHQILIVAPKPAAGQEQDLLPKLGFDYILLPSLPAVIYNGERLSLPITPALIEKLRQFNPDIIHHHNPFLVGFAGVLLSKILNIPLVGTFHGYFMEPEYLKIVNLNGDTRLLSNLLWKFAIFFFDQSDVIVTPSSVAQRDIVHHGGKRPVYVICNTIDLNKVKKIKKAALQWLREKYGLRSHVILYVGRLSREKSLDVLIKSFAHVLSQEQDISLLIIGDGPALHELVNIVNRLGIRQNVIFAGVIPQEDLLRLGYYQLADAFVTASTSECQPVTLIEAMHFGLPLIGVAHRGTAEMLDGVGLLAKPAHTHDLARQILDIIRNKNLRNRLGQISRREFAAKYAPEIVIPQYESLYRELQQRNERQRQKRIDIKINEELRKVRSHLQRLIPINQPLNQSYLAPQCGVGNSGLGS